MLKITDTVRDVIFADDIPLEAFRMGVLNLSAYADRIHALVEQKTKKKVQRNTIVVALARMQTEIQAISPIRPRISLDQLSIQPSLVDISFEKTQQNIIGVAKLSKLTSKLSFLTFSEGVKEITIVVAAKDVEQVLACFEMQPKAVIQDLVGVTVHFSEAYLQEPNLIYSILSVLASKRINLLEIVSTYTELTIIVEKENLEKTIGALQRYLEEK